jgi:hypothetical protein
MLRFPLIAFSPAGWVKKVNEEDRVFDASPHDDLSEWQGLDIYDSSGRKFRVKKAFIAWPRRSWSLWICRILNHSTYVGFVFEDPAEASLEELKKRLTAHYGDDHLPGLESVKTISEAIKLCQ